MTYPTPQAPTKAPNAKPTIAALVASDQRFSILKAAIEVTGLEPDLDNCRFGPVTVFAPQNKNFLDLIRELGITAEELLASPDLKTILLNHVVAGEVFAADLSDGLCVESLAGFELCFEINRNGIFVNGIEIVATDIEACNGVAGQGDTSLSCGRVRHRRALGAHRRGHPWGARDAERVQAQGCGAGVGAE